MVPFQWATDGLSCLYHPETTKSTTVLSRWPLCPSTTCFVFVLVGLLILLGEELYTHLMSAVCLPHLRGLGGNWGLPVSLWHICTICWL